ncbi:unnamed protein product [Clonostachys solani]|uniref:C6 zinc finger domain-containing protein n=1 Tax=Clonostachys solani TaxID=160281 RepID=A0A9P0EM95_9HYPO|nr:unnamed protein product [Clonostachys solani]
MDASAANSGASSLEQQAVSQPTTPQCPSHEPSISPPRHRGSPPAAPSQGHGHDQSILSAPDGALADPNSAGRGPKDLEALPSRSRPRPPPPHVFSEEWMESLPLLHHYTTNVALTLSRDPATAPLWGTSLPQAAFSHQFLMHGLLGVSALHYAHTNPQQEREFTFVSSRYQDLALQYFTTHLNDLNDQNFTPFFFLGTLIFLLATCSIAKPQDTEKPVSPEEIARSFSLLQGVKSIISAMPTWIQNQDGPLAPLLQMMDPVEEKQLGGFQSRLERLSALTRETSPASLDAINVRTSCLLAIESLRTTYCACKGDQSLSGSRRVWTWPMTLTQLFIELIQIAHPLALIILAHYAALVRPHEHPDWVSHGWSGNVMISVASSLGPEWHEWLAWPQRSLRDNIDVNDMSE